MFGWGKKRRNPPQKGKTDAGERFAIPTVKFDESRVTLAVQADLRECIESIPELTSADFEMIYDVALRSISKGRDLHTLAVALTSIDRIAKGRASEISRWLHNRATSHMEVERQTRLGIEYATWLYSGAPCDRAQQDADHKAANGRPYLVKQGMLLDGERTWPGRAEGCKCVSKSLIPGLGGYPGGEPEGFRE